MYNRKGKQLNNGWKDVKTTLKYLIDTAKETALIITVVRKDLGALNRKLDSHSEKLKDQDRKFEEQDKRIDALEVKQAVLKNTCDLHHMKADK